MFSSVLHLDPAYYSMYHFTPYLSQITSYTDAFVLPECQDDMSADKNLSGSFQKLSTQFPHLWGKSKTGPHICPTWSHHVTNGPDYSHSWFHTVSVCSTRDTRFSMIRFLCLHVLPSSQQPRRCLDFVPDYYYFFCLAFISLLTHQNI